MEISIRSVTAAMTHDVPFLHHVTSNETYDFYIFYKFVNVVPIDLKKMVHGDWTYHMYILRTYINTSNVKYVSMATKYIIMKHRAFFQNFNRGHITH